MNSSHHRVVQLDASRRQDRDERRPKRVEGCLRFPDVEHLNLTVRFEGYVGDAAIGCPGSGFLELGGRLVLLLLRETLRGDVEPKCHLIPRLSRGLRTSCRTFVVSLRLRLCRRSISTRGSLQPPSEDAERRKED